MTLLTPFKVDHLSSMALDQKTSGTPHHQGDRDLLTHFELTPGGRRLTRVENYTPVSRIMRGLLRPEAAGSGAQEEGSTSHCVVSEIVGQLLGEDAVLYKEKINFKAPGGAGFSPHQVSVEGAGQGVELEVWCAAWGVFESQRVGGWAWG